MGLEGRSEKNGGLAPFLAKTYNMVEDPSSDHIVSWSSTGASFIIWNSTDFCRDLLPNYFKHNNFSSFVRQLNTYGFRKICPDQWEFATEGFLKGNRDAMKTIRRRKPLASSNSSCQDQDDVEGQHVQLESPKCTMLEHQELEGKVDRLQQEKKHLLDQLTKLQHEQQGTETNLVDLANRLKAMEERQQQIVSFFARIVDPSFWRQFAQRPAESNLLLSFNKKQRQLDVGEEVLAGAEDQQGDLAGSGNSRDHKEDLGRTPIEQDEGFSRQLSLCPPCDQPPGSSLLRADGCTKEAHTSAEYPESRGCVEAAGEQQRESIGLGCSQHEFSCTGKSEITLPDSCGPPAADKQSLSSPSNNAKIAPDADKPREQVMRQLSLLPPSNQSVGTSPISLSSVTCNGEVGTPVECMETTVDDEVVHGQTIVGAFNFLRKRKQDGVCYGHPSEPSLFSRSSRKFCDDRIVLSKHLHNRLKTLVSSAPKSSRGRVRNAMVADGSGSNDGFWEKYLTESPSSTDTEPDSESDEVEDGANPPERQFL